MKDIWTLLDKYQTPVIAVFVIVVFVSLFIYIAPLFSEYLEKSEINSEINFGNLFATKKISFDEEKQIETINFSVSRGTLNYLIITIIPKSLAQKVDDVKITTNGKTEVLLTDPVIQVSPKNLPNALSLKMEFQKTDLETTTTNVIFPTEFILGLTIKQIEELTSELADIGGMYLSIEQAQGLEKELNDNIYEQFTLKANFLGVEDTAYVKEDVIYFDEDDSDGILDSIIGAINSAKESIWGEETADEEEPEETEISIHPNTFDDVMGAIRESKERTLAEQSFGIYFELNPNIVDYYEEETAARRQEIFLKSPKITVHYALGMENSYFNIYVKIFDEARDRAYTIARYNYSFETPLDLEEDPLTGEKITQEHDFSFDITYKWDGYDIDSQLVNLPAGKYLVALVQGENVLASEILAVRSNVNVSDEDVMWENLEDVPFTGDIYNDEEYLLPGDYGYWENSEDNILLIDRERFESKPLRVEKVMLTTGEIRDYQEERGFSVFEPITNELIKNATVEFDEPLPYGIEWHYLLEVDEYNDIVLTMIFGFESYFNYQPIDFGEIIIRTATVRFGAFSGLPGMEFKLKIKTMPSIDDYIELQIANTLIIKEWMGEWLPSVPLGSDNFEHQVYEIKDNTVAENAFFEILGLGKEEFARKRKFVRFQVYPRCAFVAPAETLVKAAREQGATFITTKDSDAVLFYNPKSQWGERMRSYLIKDNKVWDLQARLPATVVTMFVFDAGKLVFSEELPPRKIDRKLFFDLATLLLENKPQRGFGIDAPSDITFTESYEGEIKGGCPTNATEVIEIISDLRENHPLVKAFSDEELDTFIGAYTSEYTHLKSGECGLEPLNKIKNMKLVKHTVTSDGEFVKELQEFIEEVVVKRKESKYFGGCEFEDNPDSEMLCKEGEFTCMWKFFIKQKHYVDQYVVFDDSISSALSDIHPHSWAAMAPIHDFSDKGRLYDYFLLEKYVAEGLKREGLLEVCPSKNLTYPISLMYSENPQSRSDSIVKMLNLYTAGDLREKVISKISFCEQDFPKTISESNVEDVIKAENLIMGSETSLKQNIYNLVAEQYYRSRGLEKGEVSSLEAIAGILGRAIELSFRPQPLGTETYQIPEAFLDGLLYSWDAQDIPKPLNGENYAEIRALFNKARARLEKNAGGVPVGHIENLHKSWNRIVAKYFSLPGVITNETFPKKLSWTNIGPTFSNICDFYVCSKNAFDDCKGGKVADFAKKLDLSMLPNDPIEMPTELNYVLMFSKFFPKNALVSRTELNIPLITLYVDELGNFKASGVDEAVSELAKSAICSRYWNYAARLISDKTKIVGNIKIDQSNIAKLPAFLDDLKLALGKYYHSYYSKYLFSPFDISGLETDLFVGNETTILNNIGMLPRASGYRMYLKAKLDDSFKNFSKNPLKVNSENITKISEILSILQFIGSTKREEQFVELLDYSELSLLSDEEATVVVQKFMLATTETEPLRRSIVGRTLKFPEKITLENIDQYLPKLQLAQLVGAIPSTLKFEIDQLPDVQNFSDFRRNMEIIEIMSYFNSSKADELKNKLFENPATRQNLLNKLELDYFDLVSTRNMEELRLSMNRIDPTIGDQLLILIGQTYIEEVPVTKENLLEKLSFAEEYSHPKTSYRIDRDTKGMYKLLSNFQANKIATYVNSNLNSIKQRADYEQIKTRLSNLGYTVDDTPGAVSKFIRSVKGGHWGYAVGKAYLKIQNKIIDSDQIRKSFRVGKIAMPKENITMKPGYVVYNAMLSGQRIAKIVQGDPSRGAKARYEAKIGGGLTQEVVESKYDGDLVAEAVGAYTVGAGKMTELTVLNGEIVNWLISGRQGMAIFYPNGTLDIKNRDDLDREKTLEYGFYEADEENLMGITENIFDFVLFKDKCKELGVSIMQGHLLLYQGNIMLGMNASRSKDKRRLLALYPEGKFAIIDFEGRITLAEAAYLAKRTGAVSAMNLDTGYYDHANYYSIEGDRHPLGQQDKEGTNNKVIFCSLGPYCKTA